MVKKLSLLSLLAVSVLSMPVMAEEAQNAVEKKEDGRVVFDLGVKNDDALQSDEDESLPWLKDKKKTSEVLDSQGDEISAVLEGEVVTAENEAEEAASEGDENAEKSEGDDEAEVAGADADEDKGDAIELVKELDMYGKPDIVLDYLTTETVLNDVNKKALAVLFEAENRDADLKVRLYAKADAGKSLSLRRQAMKELYGLRKYFIESGKKDRQISLFVIVEPEVEKDRIELFL